MMEHVANPISFDGSEAVHRSSGPWTMSPRRHSNGYCPQAAGCQVLLLLLVLSFGCVDLTPPWELAVGGGQGAFGGEGGNVGLGGRAGALGTSSTGAGLGVAAAAHATGGIGLGVHGSGGTAGNCAALDAKPDADGTATGFGGSKGAAAAGGDGGRLGSDAAVDGTSCSCRQCDGVTDSSVCWRLGSLGATCATTCADRGGTSAAARSHIGTSAEGGSQRECQRLFGLFGILGSVVPVSINAGLGCHMRLGVLWPYAWTSSPAYSENASSADVRILCGCVL